MEDLALRCEQDGPSRALNREIALAAGWHRYSPSEIGKSNPGWIAPEDFIGEYVGKDGRRTPKLDSLHGTDIWREPRNYVTSIDNAFSLIPDSLRGSVLINISGQSQVHIYASGDGVAGRGDASSPAMAVCAAALRARAYVQSAKAQGGPLT